MGIYTYIHENQEHSTSGFGKIPKAFDGVSAAVARDPGGQIAFDASLCGVLVTRLNKFYAK